MFIVYFDVNNIALHLTLELDQLGSVGNKIGKIKLWSNFFLLTNNFSGQVDILTKPIKACCLQIFTDKCMLFLIKSHDILV